MTADGPAREEIISSARTFAERLKAIQRDCLDDMTTLRSDDLEHLLARLMEADAKLQRVQEAIDAPSSRIDVRTRVREAMRNDVR